MGRRTWAITALCGLVAVACGVTAVVAAQNRSEAEDRQAAAEQQLSTATRLEALQTELDAQHDAQTELEARAAALAALFTPDAVNAVAQVQADAMPGACALARTATRNATPPPNPESYVAYAVAAATNPALDGLSDRWGRMIDPTALQTEIDRCTADETAIMEAERQAAASAAATQCPSDTSLVSADGVIDGVNVGVEYAGQCRFLCPPEISQYGQLFCDD